MAIYLDGFVACESETHAMSFKQSLGELEFLHPIPDTAIQRDSLWWISFVPKGLGLGVPYDTDQMRQDFGPNASKLISAIYKRLKGRTDFKIFLVGWEACDTFFAPEEIDHIRLGGVRFPEHLYTTEGLVLSNELYELHQRKAKFTPFCAGYHWIPCRDGQWKSPYDKPGTKN